MTQTPVVRIVAPMRAARFPYFSAPFLALAHRGGFCADAPPAVENTLRAFRAATALGYTHLETDVHLTADGRLVAFHDEVLDRVTDAEGAILDLPWSQVSEARIGGTEPIPLLSDLLEDLPEARFNIDLKAEGAVEALATTIEAHNAHDRVCVGSFDARRLRTFRRLTEGRVATSAHPAEVVGAAALPGVRRFWPLGAAAFQVPVRHKGVPVVTAEMVANAHRRGVLVHVWTINDRPEMERLIELGVDGLVSDDLETLKAVLVERDLWEGTR